MWHIGLASVFVILNIFAVNAQLPKPCNVNPQLSFRLLQVDHEYLHIRRYGGMYDGLNKRVAFIESDVTVVPGQQFYKFIFLYGQGVAYEINMNTKKCTRAPSGPFLTWDVPANSTMEDVYVMGGPSESFEAVEWSDRLPTRSASWIGIYTFRDCFPVSTFLYANENVNRSAKMDVFDITEGLISPEDFIPPVECQQQETVAHAPLSEQGTSLHCLFSEKCRRR